MNISRKNNFIIQWNLIKPGHSINRTLINGPSTGDYFPVYLLEWVWFLDQEDGHVFILHLTTFKLHVGMLFFSWYMTGSRILSWLGRDRYIPGRLPGRPGSSTGSWVASSGPCALSVDFGIMSSHFLLLIMCSVSVPTIFICQCIFFGDHINDSSSFHGAFSVDFFVALIVFDILATSSERCFTGCDSTSVRIHWSWVPFDVAGFQ